MSATDAPARAGRPLLDDAPGRRAMVWIMAIMIFLTVLATALGLGMTRAGQALDRQLAGRLTVQVVDADAGRRDTAVRRLLATLGASANVAQAREVDRARLAELMRPWLGEAGLDADLPIPAMIDVDLTTADDAAVAEVERAARAASPNVRVDRHAAWLSPVRGFLATIAWVAGGLIVLMATATAAVVLLAARAGLDTHRGTIDVLHMLGSTDVQIARLFQRRIAADTLRGGVVGAVLAGAVTLLLGAQLGGLEGEVLAGVRLAAVDWLWLAAVPAGFVLLAVLAARVAVLRTLGQVL